MFYLLVDEEISLKLGTVRDAEALFTIIDHARGELRTFLPWVDEMTSVEDTANYLQQSLTGFAQGNVLTAIIYCHGMMCGVAGYNQLDQKHRTAQIGYWLIPEFQGRGIATKGAAALTTEAFNSENMYRVEIRAAVENVNSLAVPERLGFVKEGTLRGVEHVHGTFLDHVVYSTLASEWRS
ncbi:ribosomal-protein-serine acetyltransferase [Salsuginibacillus halophilus]|uniref:Ribosomal-protein-serine acetyltransferase n=1 Tax=Salsuginibacillus halophilus TaxID=517424 RepID=A0A2P8HW07_9BACI|nr:GNAT family protein [Salsuginibacillus halophilus]PSL50423.1 ribosomal-protein-serine acetyltransferase [Salsuginibacillus halophilus]